MKITSISPSSAGTYQDCSWKYYLQKIIGYPSTASPKMACGTVVHKVCELLAKFKQRNKTASVFCDPDYLLDISIKHVFKKEGLEYTKEHVDFCRKQLKVILKSPYSPLEREVLFTEHGFELQIKRPGLELDGDNYFVIRGIIDRVDLIDEDTIEVLDYKTGKNSDWNTGIRKDFDTLKHDLQMQVYELAIRRLFPQYKYRMLTMFFTDDGGPVTTHFEDKDDEMIIDEIRRIFHKIKNDDFPRRLKDDFTRKEQHFKCKFVCEFGSKYKNTCDGLYRQFDKGILVPLTMEKKPRAGKSEFIKIDYL